MLTEGITLATALFLLAYSSNKVVEYAEKLAFLFHLPTFFIGAFIVAVGTDLPEIANSIISSALGHGDINVGDSLGSCLTQITIVLAVISILFPHRHINKEAVIVLGGAAIFPIIFLSILASDDFLSRLDAFFLIILFFFEMAFVYKHFKIHIGELHDMKREKIKYTILLLAWLGIVVASSYVVVEGLVLLSKKMAIEEYILSFFLASFGTSLPELAVEIMAIRKRKTGIFLGDLIGSNIVDATFAVGIGALLFPIKVSGRSIIITSIYILFSSLLIFSLLAKKERIDVTTAVVASLLYMGAIALFL